MLTRSFLGAALSALAVLAVPAAPAAAQGRTPATGLEVLERMRSAYAGKWYSTLTFVQKTTIHRPDSAVVQTWHETVRYTPERGTQLRIDFGDLAAGNGVIYTADSVWIVRGGKLVATRGTGNEFLPLIEGVYMQPVAKTAEELRHTNVDLQRVRSGTWRGRPVWVVGTTTAADTTSPQFWVDAERKVVVRFMLPGGAPNDPGMDVTLDNYVPVGGGWLGTKVLISSGGVLRQSEEYTQWKGDVAVPASMFDPATWTAAPHWGATKP